MTSQPERSLADEAALIARTIASEFLGPLAVGAGFADGVTFDEPAARAAIGRMLDEAKAALTDRLTQVTDADSALRDMVALQLVLTTTGAAADAVRSELVEAAKAEADAASDTTT